MNTSPTLLHLTLLLLTTPVFGQLKDSLTEKREIPVTKQPDYFRVFTGGLNAIYQQHQSKGSFDLAVQSCHYYLITGRRYKNDSIHQLLVERKESIAKTYRGFHFYLLNRAAVNLDSIKSLASEYLTSLKSSPFTLRLRKEFYLTRQRVINSSNYSPVISLMLIGDGRAIPFVDKSSGIHLGVSSHLYLTFSSMFKRLEFDTRGKMIDQGTIYFRPSIGIGYGSKQMMTNIHPRGQVKPILSTDWRLGFQSDKVAIKDFTFIMSYTITEIVGPKLRAGVLLSAIQ